MDGLDIVYNILINDNTIQQYCHSDLDGFRIKYFEYPETGDVSGPIIVMESILNALPSSFADNTWVTNDFLLHIEVWSKNRNENRIVASRIRDLLWERLRFVQNDSIDEYDVGIFRDARRYKGKLHRSDLIKL